MIKEEVQEETYKDRKDIFYNCLFILKVSKEKI